MSSLKQHSGRRTGLLKYLLVTIAISLSALQMAAAVGEVSGPQTLALASHSTGSSWNVYASAMAGMFRDALPPGSVVDVLPYAAALGNVYLVESQDADLGLTFSHVAAWGYQGTVAFVKDGAMDQLRAIAGGLDQYYGGVIMRRDFAERHNVKSIADVVTNRNPIRIVTGPPGSLSEYMTGLLLEVAGASYDDVRSWGGSVEHVDVPTAGDMLTDGYADAFVSPFTVGYPSFTEIAARSQVVFPDVDEALLEALAQYGFMSADFPAGSFRGQDQPVRAMAFKTMLFARTDLDDAVAYQITRALIENVDRLHAVHASLTVFDPEEAWHPDLLGGLPLHPGAEAYYRDAGLMD